MRMTQFRLLLPALLATLVAACGDSAEQAVTATEEQEAAPQLYSAEEFFMTTAYGLAGGSGFAFSPDDNSLLIASDESGVFNAYAIDIESGAMRQLTDSTENAIFPISWFPEDSRILYTYDSGGNELNHVVVREEDGSYRDLTPGDSLKAGFIGWHDDGKSFYLYSNERDAKSFDVYQYSADDYSRAMIFENVDAMGIDDISGDGRWLQLTRPRTSADSNIYLADLNGDKTPQLVTEHTGNIEYGGMGFTPDSGVMLYSTNENGEFSQVWQYDLASTEKSLLLKADWDVWYMFYSPSGRYQVSGVNADARTEVTITDTGTGQVVTLTELPAGDLNAIRFSRDEQEIALVVNADNSPSDIYFVNLATQKSTQLTSALNDAIDRQILVSSEIVRYKSFDGLDIPSVLYKPLTASAANPVPALVFVHGGPGGQSRAGYSPMIQHLVNHGYAVLMANNRGSTGYGKTFYHLDDRKHGEEDLLDIVYGRKYLESLDWVDGDKIGVMGGSYGGFMVAAALAFHPEAFDVGIDIFGVTNWVRTLESIPPWWEAIRESLYDEMGDPAVDGERHRKISPLFHAGNIVRPTLVVQGANDPRVLQAESDELVAAIRANEVPVEYVLFPDEGHGFRKRENRIAASEAYVKFLNTYLR